MEQIAKDLLDMVQNAVDRGWGHTVRLGLLIAVICVGGGFVLTSWR